MAKPVITSARRTPSTATLLAGLGLLAALVAFLAGRWTAEEAAPAPGARRATSGASRGPAAPPEKPWASRTPETETLATAAARAPAPTTSTGRATPEIVARATAETTAVLEASRQELTSRCWPRAGLSSGKASTLVTFNVTYDANGREIARGLSEDRQARAPEVVRCLQRLPLGSLRIAPPGANVGVRVAMRLP
jgi:hypothetical protein